MMKSSIFTASAALAVGSAFFLSACGGGGGTDNGGSSVSTGTQSGSSITAANSTMVAAQATSASSALIGGSTAASSVAAGVSVNTANNGLIDSALRQMDKALKVPSADVATGVATTQSINCSNGGTLVVAAHFSASGKVTNGDSLSLSANNCIEGGTTASGSVTIGFSNINGNPRTSSVWSATLDLTFNNFTIAHDSLSDMLNGDLSLAFSRTGDNSASFTGSGNSLQLHSVKDNEVTDRILTAYSVSAAVDAANVRTYRTNFTLAGNFPTLGNNTFTVRTLTDFVQQGNNNPSAGVLSVTASDNSSLTLTALDSTNVQISVDNNGDGVVDQTTTTTWSDLRNMV